MSNSGQTKTCAVRFGCWVCTVVKEDKSLNGFIRTGHRDYFAEFRAWLMSIRDKEEYREKSVVMARCIVLSMDIWGLDRLTGKQEN